MRLQIEMDVIKKIKRDGRLENHHVCVGREKGSYSYWVVQDDLFEDRPKGREGVSSRNPLAGKASKQGEQQVQRP